MNDPLFRDAGFMYGHAVATRTLVRALARTIGVEEAWREEARAQLQRLLDITLAQPTPNTGLVAIEQAIEDLDRFDAGRH